jgi:hypothetical protein
MPARASSALVASALVRGVQAQGGFAAILHKGDADAGGFLVIGLEKGRVSGLFEPQLNAIGSYPWTRIGPQDIENKEEISSMIERRRARDPDLWVIELDIPDVERFIAQYPREA